MLSRSVALIGILITIATVVPHGPASAQDSTHSSPAAIVRSDTTSHVAGLRNPVAAAVLGTVVPGAGLAYAGHWLSAAGTYFVSVGTISLGSVLMVGDRCTFSLDSGCNPGRVWPQRTLGVGLIALGVGTWAYNAVDAYRIVKHENATKLTDRGLSLDSVTPMLSVPIARGEPWTIGVHASW
jgi:hypothetical protein